MLRRSGAVKHLISVWLIWAACLPYFLWGTWLSEEYIYTGQRPIATNLRKLSACGRRKRPLPANLGIRHNRRSICIRGLCRPLYITHRQLCLQELRAGCAAGAEDHSRWPCLFICTLRKPLCTGMLVCGGFIAFSACDSGGGGEAHWSLSPYCRQDLQVHPETHLKLDAPLGLRVLSRRCVWLHTGATMRRHRARVCGGSALWRSSRVWQNQRLPTALYYGGESGNDLLGLQGYEPQVLNLLALLV